MIGRLVDFAGAIWVLVSLAMVSGFRLRGRYWSWRIMTAFPSGRAPGGMVGFRLVLEYAMWAWRIRRLR